MVNPPAFSSLAAGKSPSETVSSGNSTAEMKEVNGFYEKLNKLNESSSLTLPFNFRETTLDLQQLYKNVTQRGGYREVTKDGKWEDVACSVSPDTWTPSQLEKIYATILYQFEQTYHYRSPKKSPKRPDTTPLVVPDLKNLKGKRKRCDGFYVTQQRFSDEGSPSEKFEENHGRFQKSFPGDAAVSTVENKRQVFESTQDEVKELRKEPRVPLGSRNCYQMFIKMESDKLKGINGDISSAQLKSMNEAWKRLSRNDKTTYIKASKKDKERYVREIAAYEEHKREQRNRLQKTTKNATKASSPNLIDDTTHLPEALGGSNVENDGDYHVTLQPDDSDEIALVWNESLAQMAVELMKNAQPCDQWDWYSGLIDVNHG